MGSGGRGKMKHKYLSLCTAEDIIRHHKFSRANLYNPLFKSYYGNCCYHSMENNKSDGNNNTIFNILNDKKEIIGMIKFCIDRYNQMSNICGIYIEEKYHNKGYGAKAMKEFMRFVKTRFNRVELNTSSKRLVKFYEQFGFKLYGTATKRLRLPDEKLYDDYFMEWLK